MKVIVQNFSPKHCMEVVEQKINDEKLKFKIVSSNGNCYSKLEVYILNNNGLQLIFEKEDIPGYQHVDYQIDNDRRLNLSKLNLFAAEDLIKKVFK